MAKMTDNRAARKQDQNDKREKLLNDVTPPLSLAAAFDGTPADWKKTVAARLGCRGQEQGMRATFARNDFKRSRARAVKGAK